MKDAKTLKELIEYEKLLASLQIEYENKLHNSKENMNSMQRERLIVITNLIQEERNNVNTMKYKPSI